VAGQIFDKLLWRLACNHKIIKRKNGKQR
jgi:hypothetical protein